MSDDLGRPDADRREDPASTPRPAGLERERGISPVGRRFGSTNAGKALGVVSMVILGALVIVATWDRDDETAGDLETPQPARQVVTFEPARAPPPPVLDPTAPTSPIVPALAPSASGAAPAAQPVNPAVTLAESARRAPIMAFSENRQRSGAAELDTFAAGRPQPAAREAHPLDRLRQASSIGQSRARMLPDRNFLVAAGAVIPCVLQTALDTATPGYASCLIPRDVYSDNGAVILMEKGTKVLGEYRGGIQRGQNRLFVLWNRAVTPTGVAIDLASPASDALGRAGVGGDVESFFWARFGGALLLSVVDDGVYVLADQAGSNVQNTARVPSNAASVALENSINIPPVLRKNQGEEVGILVAQDFNFADVYGLRLR